MTLPQFAKNPRLTAAAPALTAGIDRHRPAGRIADNALSDADGVWWQEGTLCCRPGFRTLPDRVGWADSTDGLQWYTDREGYRVMLSYDHYEYEERMITTVNLTAFAPDGTATGGGWARDFSHGTRAFCVGAGGSTPEYTTLLFFSNGVVMGLHPRERVLEDISHRVYLPLLMVNGKPVTQRADTTANGVLYESRNRLTERFRCHFTSDGTGVYYYLPLGEVFGYFSVTLCRDGGDQVFEIGSDSTVSVNAQNGLILHLDRAAGCFWFTNEAGAPTALTDSGRRNNVQAEAAVPHTELSPCEMTFGAWYGGDRSTAAGGTRLFLGGSDRSSATVLWSALDDPLYFPFSGYAVVGDPGEPLTAFGKQGGLLVLFKPHEIYTAQYVAGSAVSADDLESGRVTDITAAAATFPLTPLHTEIGCDLPHTVALPGNRLVWACADGTVYGLTSVGGLSQHNVVRLSENIRPYLKTAETPSVASAVACEGRYWLLWGDQLLVMTEGDTPVWHRFTWPQNGTVPLHLTRAGTVVLLAAARPTERGNGIFWFSADGEADTVVTHTGTGYFDVKYAFSQRPVTGMLCTKAYDMGQSDTYKSVESIAVELTARGAVQASYLTERGEQADRPVTPDADGILRLTPHLTHVRQLGLRLTGEGLNVGGVTVRFRGGMR